MHEPRTTIIKRVFLSIVDEPAHEHEALLAQSTSEASVRAAVRELLRHEREAAPSFLAGADGGEGGGVGGVGGGSRDALFEPGSIVGGRYRVEEEIGEGGFSRVYRAEQTTPITRKVAMKVLKRGMDSEAVVERFRGEQQTLAHLSHPNIATVLDAGITDDGRPWFAMELVDGEPIDRYAARHRLGIRARIELMLQAMNAVAHAHQHGLIHRDIKPSNILVEGEPKSARVSVIDFGIAKALGGTAAPSFTSEGSFLGTLEYCSPEQASASVRMDTRSDVYSMGAVLYELLTGSKVYDDPGALLLRSGPSALAGPVRPSTRVSAARSREVEPRGGHAEERGTTISSLRRALRGDIDWILLRALAPDPEQRYRTMLDFADDLGRSLRLEPVEAGPPSVVYRTRRFIARHRWPALLGLLLALSVVVGLIGTTAGMHRANLSAGSAIRSAERAMLSNAAIAIESGRRAPVFQDILGADMPDSWARRYLAQRIDSAELFYEPALDDRPLMIRLDEASRQAIVLGERTMVRFDADPAGDGFGAILERHDIGWDATYGSSIIGSGAFALIAAPGGGSEVWSMEEGRCLWTTDKRLRVPTRPDAPTDFAGDARADSIIVLNINDSQLERRDIRTGSVLWSMGLGMLEPLRFAVSSDEQLAVAFDQAIGLEAGFDLVTGQRLWERRKFSTSARFHGDRERFDSIEYGRYETLDARTGVVLARRDLSTAGAWGSHRAILGGLVTIAIDPQGWLFVDGGDGVGGGDGRSGDAMNGIAKRGSMAAPIRYGLAFADGSAAFAVSRRDGVVYAWRWPLGTGDLKRVPPAMWSSFAGDVSRDGRLLAQAGWGDVIVWDTATGLPIWRRTVSRFYLLACEFDRAAERVAVGGVNGRIEILDARTGDRLVRVENEFETINAIAWSGDGTRLLAAGDPAAIVEFDAASGAVVRRYEGHTGSVRAIAWDDARDGFVSAGDVGARESSLSEGWAASGEVIAWVRGQERPRHRWLIDADAPISLTIDPSRRRVLVGHRDGRVSGIHLDYPHRMEALANLQEPINTAAWMADGGFAVGLGDGTIVVFRGWGDARPLLTLRCMDDGSIHTLAYRAGDDAIIASGSGQPLALLATRGGAGIDDARIAEERTMATALWGLAIAALAQESTAMAASRSLLQRDDLDPRHAERAAGIVLALGEPVNALFNTAVMMASSPDRPAPDYRMAARLLTPFRDDAAILEEPGYALVLALVLMRVGEHDASIAITGPLLDDPGLSDPLRMIAMSTHTIALARSARRGEALLVFDRLRGLLAASPALRDAPGQNWMLREAEAAIGGGSE